jgi:hypothetical protein
MSTIDYQSKFSQLKDILKWGLYYEQYM